MNRLEIANSYHDKGFNCCQSVLAAFGDRLGVPEETYLRLGSGFGRGAGTGELCGALTGAIMALDLMLPAELSDPVGSKQRATARAKRLQERFDARFGALRCAALLRNEKEERSAAVEALGVTNHCAVMIATAVELVEGLLEEETAA